MSGKPDSKRKAQSRREEKRKLERKEKQRQQTFQADRTAKPESPEALLELAQLALSYGLPREAYRLSKQSFIMSPTLAAYQFVCRIGMELKKNDELYPIFAVAYRKGYFSDRHELIAFAQDALRRNDKALARELLTEALSNSGTYAGSLNSELRMYAITMLASCDEAAKLKPRIGFTERARARAPALAMLEEFAQSFSAAWEGPRGTKKATKSAAKSASKGAKAAVKTSTKGAKAGPASYDPDATLLAKEEKTGKSLPAAPPPEEPLPPLETAFSTASESLTRIFGESGVTSLERLHLTLAGYQFSFMSSYDQLICLAGLQQVQSYWHQEETARKVMKSLRGRALLADEVGLGKTIEACIVLKEYQQRGLVRSALVLVPSSLVEQWRCELRDKFDLHFATSQDPLFRSDSETFWKQPFLVVSLPSARLKRHYTLATARSWDMLIVDEAHHLKNRTTLNWKLVNELQKTFILLLTATPVQNRLEELFNLVTLLKPGHLKTQKSFKDEFVARGDPSDPKNREKLRELLKAVMVRNTRSVARLNLPPRFASTIRIEPSKAELAFYQGIDALIAEQNAAKAPLLTRLILRKLLEAAGSSHFAASSMLQKLRITSRGDAELAGSVARLIELSSNIGSGAKLKRIVELLRASPGQKIVFVNYRATLMHLHELLKNVKMPHAVFHGSMNRKEKLESMDRFRGGCPVLLATESGGEGHNLQFCQTLVNCDLPWNPMRIEQRIGRIHRIGQEKEVHVYNFCAAGSIEDYILDILDRKINMFELVIGEMDMILGHLKGENEFGDLVYELWLGSVGEQGRKKAFDGLGSQLQRARSLHQKTKELDEKLFREDFGV